MKRMTNSTWGKNTYDLFPELASSLLHFIETLHGALIEKGVKQVFFLSREGQPLMRMFEMYQARVGGQITTHYLEVSRRSTLLPSLAPLTEEKFETLFRQYRRISLLEFLSSLGLQAQTRSIAKALGLPEGNEALREEDFPTSLTFTILKTLPQFQQLYESQRATRRRAFIAYLSELSGGTLPDRLVIVDVGWKGTIQDNLYALLCCDDGAPVKSITGYYLGLVAHGAAGPCNDKHGLLFSGVDSRSPGFSVFNENRALFEVVLAADHGSIVSYEIDELGRGRAVRGQFEEGEMLAAEVFPVLRNVFAHYQRLVNELPVGQLGAGKPFKAVVRSHARMVFKPTSRERAWFSSVFHVENYGVFERSGFSTLTKRPGIAARLRFMLSLLCRRDVGVLGFWPWNTLRERGGFVAATAYAIIRRLQN